MTGFERPLASEVTAVPTVPQSLPLGDRVTSMTSQWWNIANYFCQIPLQNMSSWGSYATRWLSDIVYLPIWRNVLPNITFQRQITALCPRPYSIDTFVDKLYTRLHNTTRKPKEQFLFIANEIIFLIFANFSSNLRIQWHIQNDKYHWMSQKILKKF